MSQAICGVLVVYAPLFDLPAVGIPKLDELDAVGIRKPCLAVADITVGEDEILIIQYLRYSGAINRPHAWPYSKSG